MSNPSFRFDTVMLAVVSLVLSVLLWLQVSVQETEMREREITASINYLNVSEDLYIRKEIEFVRVVFKGPAKAIERLDTERSLPYVDLAKKGPGTYELLLQTPELGNEIAVTLSRRTVPVTLERLGREQKPVQVEVRGIAPPGLSYEGATPQPATVSVVGPESELKRIEKVRAMLDLAAIRPGVSHQLELEALAKGNTPLPLISIEPKDINVFPAVASAPTTNTFLISPQWKGVPPVGTRILSYDMVPKSIQLSGSSADLAQVSTISTAPIELSGVTSDRTIAVKLLVPPELTNGGPSEVRITVKVARSRP